MAGSLQREHSVVSIASSADLSGKEGYHTRIASSKVELSNSATALPFGVIVSGEKTDGQNSVATFGEGGTVKVKLGSSPGTVAVGTYLVLKNDGTFKADTGSGGRVLCAMALEAGAADELIEASLIGPQALS